MSISPVASTVFPLTASTSCVDQVEAVLPKKFEVPTIDDKGLQRLQHLLTRPMILECRRGFNAHIEITLQEIFSLFPGSRKQLVGSVVWPVLGLEYVKTCLGENYNYERFTHKLREKPVDQDYRILFPGLDSKTLERFGQLVLDLLADKMGAINEEETLRLFENGPIHSTGKAFKIACLKEFVITNYKRTHFTSPNQFFILGFKDQTGLETDLLFVSKLVDEYLFMHNALYIELGEDRPKSFHPETQQVLHAKVNQELIIPDTILTEKGFYSALSSLIKGMYCSQVDRLIKSCKHPSLEQIKLTVKKHHRADDLAERMMLIHLAKMGYEVGITLPQDYFLFLDLAAFFNGTHQLKEGVYYYPKSAEPQWDKILEYGESHSSMEEAWKLLKHFAPSTKMAQNNAIAPYVEKMLMSQNLKLLGITLQKTFDVTVSEALLWEAKYACAGSELQKQALIMSMAKEGLYSCALKCFEKQPYWNERLFELLPHPMAVQAIEKIPFKYLGTLKDEKLQVVVHQRFVHKLLYEKSYEQALKYCERYIPSMKTQLIETVLLDAELTVSCKVRFIHPIALEMDLDEALVATIVGLSLRADLPTKKSCIPPLFVRFQAYTWKFTEILSEYDPDVITPEMTACIHANLTQILLHAKTVSPLVLKYGYLVDLPESVKQRITDEIPGFLEKCSDDRILERLFAALKFLSIEWNERIIGSLDRLFREKPFKMIRWLQGNCEEEKWIKFAIESLQIPSELDMEYLCEYPLRSHLFWESLLTKNVNCKVELVSKILRILEDLGYKWHDCLIDLVGKNVKNLEYLTLHFIPQGAELKLLGRLFDSNVSCNVLNTYFFMHLDKIKSLDSREYLKIVLTYTELCFKNKKYEQLKKICESCFEYNPTENELCRQLGILFIKHLPADLRAKYIPQFVNIPFDDKEKIEILNVLSKEINESAVDWALVLMMSVFGHPNQSDEKCLEFVNHYIKVGDTAKLISFFENPRFCTAYDLEKRFNLFIHFVKYSKLSLFELPQVQKLITDQLLLNPKKMPFLRIRIAEITHALCYYPYTPRELLQDWFTHAQETAENAGVLPRYEILFFPDRFSIKNFHEIITKDVEFIEHTVEHACHIYGQNYVKKFVNPLHNYLMKRIFIDKENPPSCFLHIQLLFESTLVNMELFVNYLHYFCLKLESDDSIPESTVITLQSTLSAFIFLYNKKMSVPSYFAARVMVDILGRGSYFKDEQEYLIVVQSYFTILKDPKVADFTHEAIFPFIKSILNAFPHHQNKDSRFEELANYLKWLQSQGKTKLVNELVQKNQIKFYTAS